MESLVLFWRNLINLQARDFIASNQKSNSITSNQPVLV